MKALKLDVTLNEQLIKDKKLSGDEVLLIKNLHAQRICIEECMLLEDNQYILRDLNQLWMSKQRELQRAWKFPQDDNYIRFWTVPQCSCPQMDNEENCGYSRSIINLSCKVHGD